MTLSEELAKPPSKSLRLADLILEELYNGNKSKNPCELDSSTTFDKQVWWNGLENHGFVSLRHEIYRALLDAVNEPLLEEEGRKAGSQLASYLRHKYKNAKIETLLDYIITLASQFGLGRTRTEQRDVKYVVVMYHNFGRRHSLFVRSIWDSAVTSLAGITPKTQIGDNVVMSELDISPIPVYKLT